MRIVSIVILMSVCVVFGAAQTVRLLASPLKNVTVSHSYDFIIAGTCWKENGRPIHIEDGKWDACWSKAVLFHNMNMDSPRAHQMADDMLGQIALALHKNFKRDALFHAE